MPPFARRAEAIGFAVTLLILSLVASYFMQLGGQVGRSILPMHGPVLLAGMILSPIYAAIVGLLAPAVSSGLTGYPLAGQAMRWMIELAACGAGAALVMGLYARGSSKRNFAVWSLFSVLAVLGGLVAAFAVNLLVGLADVGAAGVGYYIKSFFSSSPVSYLLLILLVPPLGLKLRQTAQH